MAGLPQLASEFRVGLEAAVGGSRRDRRRDKERRFSAASLAHERALPAVVSAWSLACRIGSAALDLLCAGPDRGVPPHFPLGRVPLNVSPACGSRGLPQLLRGWLSIHDSAP